MSERLKKRLDALKEQKHAGFVPFIMAGDPDIKTTKTILNQLPQHGADVIELGMPFSDPMADGPTIQLAGMRALKSGTKTSMIFDLVRNFRQNDQNTPIILMGYFNTVFYPGVENFMKNAADAGADGLILVDVPQEERAEIQSAADNHGLSIITLIAPTSLENRIELLTHNAQGFVYYIAVKGITGDKSADYDLLEKEIATLRQHTNIPVAAGFGIKSPEDVAAISAYADLVVVGSRIVQEMETQDETLTERVLATCASLSAGITNKH